MSRKIKEAEQAESPLEAVPAREIDVPDQDHTPKEAANFSRQHILACEGPYGWVRARLFKIRPSGSVFRQQPREVSEIPSAAVH